MTRLEALIENGCTVGEAEIIALKLDVLGSDEERAEWINRHLPQFLAAIRRFSDLEECWDAERKCNAALASIQDCTKMVELAIAKDPYCEEVKMLKHNLAVQDSVRTRLFKRPPRTYEEMVKQSALQREAEDALVQAVAIKDGGNNGKR